MSQRDKAGGKAIRVRRRKTSTRPSAAVGNLKDQLDRRTRELNESREQQAATLEVLKVISSSSGDLARVFDAVLERATRLCDATHGLVWRFDGEWLHVAAVRGDPQFVEWLHQHSTVRPAPGSAADRIVRGARFDHMADRREESAYRDNQTFRRLVDTGGIRASLCVAVRSDETLLGMINVYRQEIRPFTDKQIALVENFAAQAVIAIENTRLLNELRESLQQQTAASEVLKVISSAGGQLGPVFQAILANAVRICEAKFGQFFSYKDGKIEPLALHGVTEPFANFLHQRGAIAPRPGSALERLVNTKTTIHVEDYAREADTTNPAVTLGGARSYLAVPMLREDDLIGLIVPAGGSPFHRQAD
jgi:GAF domain-containing protein